MDAFLHDIDEDDEIQIDADNAEQEQVIKYLEVTINEWTRPLRPLRKKRRH